MHSAALDHRWRVVLMVMDVMLMVLDMVVRIQDMVVRIQDMVVRIQDMVVRIQDMVVRIQDMVVRIQDVVVRIQDVVVHGVVVHGVLMRGDGFLPNSGDQSQFFFMSCSPTHTMSVAQRRMVYPSETCCCSQFGEDGGGMGMAAQYSICPDPLIVSFRSNASCWAFWRCWPLPRRWR